MLLSDGSGLTARQVATQLSDAGHAVEVLTPDPLALTRFTRHVRRLHEVPPYGNQPFAWLDAALDVYRSGRFDVLFPTQEQVAVLSRSPDALRSAGVATVVPPFRALVAVQDKIAARATLLDAGLPQPDSAVVTTASALSSWGDLPAFVKTPIGTATTGVHRVADAAELHALASRLDAAGAFGDGGVVVQAPADGRLAMVQAVFADGTPVATHANLRVREGVGGGASHKRSVDLPEVREYVGALGHRLGWHGALSADVILTRGGPRFIDVNPRLVEPGNARRAGVDLVGPLLELATGGTPAVQVASSDGVGTHQLILAVLGAAQRAGTRRAVLAEIGGALRHRGAYRDSTEELTPIRGDVRASVPVVVASVATLVRPALWSAFASGAVSNYALTPAGWREILRGPPP